MTDEPNPWSKDVPATPAPAEFLFDEPRPRADSAPVDVDTAARRRWVGVAVVLSVVVIGVVAASALRPDEAASDTPDVTEPTIADNDPDRSPPPTTQSVEPTETEAAPSTPATQLPTVADEPSPAPTWVDGQLELPDRLRDIAVPTQLVVLSQQGLVIEIDIPSGRTSTIDLDQRRSGRRLDVRNNASLVIGESGSTTPTPTVVRSRQSPVEVDMPDEAAFYDWFGISSNVAPFVINVVSRPANPSSPLQSRTMFIDAAGIVTEVAATWERLLFGQYEVSTGELLVVDAGDLFVVSPPGTEPATARRISTGRLLGRSPTSLLVNECDAERSCGNVLVDVDSGDRTPVPDVDGVDFNVGGFGTELVSMSPDGTALLLDNDSDDADDNSIIVELRTGAVTQVPIPGRTSVMRSTLAWALDGSGIFTLDDDAIVFIDRFTGDVTSLPIEFGGNDKIVDIGARPLPDS